MKTYNTAQSTHDVSGRKSHVRVRDWVRFALLVLLYPLVLFLSAGTLEWFSGWVYIGLLFAITAGSRLLVARKHPDLLAERARSMVLEGAKDWDRKLVPFIGIIGPLAIMVVAGLNVRFAWQPTVPPAAQWIGLILFAVGGAFGAWAMMENKFFSGVVRIQTDRGQTVVSTGPYHWVRHPGYVSAILSWLVTPFALGSMWALIPALLTIALMVVRTALEDRTLREELPGYVEYSQRTRYRLVPGVW